MRKVLRKIHRWVGVFSALWLLQLATTGLLLQHADNFRLTSTFVNTPWVLKWFGYGQRQQAWETEGEVFYQVEDVLAYAENQIKLADKLVAAVKYQQDWWAISKQGIYRYNMQGDLVMQLDSFDGIPTPIEQVALTDQKLAIQSTGRWFTLDSNGETSPAKKQPTDMVQVRGMTAAEQNKWFPQMLSNHLSYDKVVHGIHSGIKSSNWLNTLSALALFYLCFSGLYLFFKQPKSKRSQ